MKRRIGILTSGGDCPGLNAAIRGVARASYEMFDAEIVGIMDGYRGLIEGEWQEMKRSQFSGILTLGGTILGTSRQPFRNMRVIGEDQVDKVAAMKKNFAAMKLDCLVTLGGNGTHKTANLLSQEGLPVIGLPKTIDNDIYGTDFTFGFHTAVDIATEVIDRIHTTAASHGRCMVIEIMGNKAGWLTLYSGLAGGADVVLLPEIPYDIKQVAQVVETRAKSKKAFSIIAVAEGAMDKKEAKMKKKEREAYRQETGFDGVANRLRSARAVDDGANSQTTGVDVDELPGDLALDALPAHEALGLAALVLPADHEGDEAGDDEDVGGLEAGHHARIQLAREGQDGCHDEDDEADDLFARHLAELLVGLLEVLPAAAKGLFLLDVAQHEDDADDVERDHDRQEADNPVDVHVLLAGELLDVLDCDEVHRAAERGG